MKIKLSESKLKQIVAESVKNVLSERTKKPITGVIEWGDGNFIPAVEDGVDRYGNVMYKVKDTSIKGRRCKDGSIRVQSFRFWPDKE